MTSTALPRQSLKTRITLSTLAIFVVSLWSLSFYASQMLHRDMERLSGEQQFSTASFMATVILHELQERLSALEKVARTTAPAILDNTAALQTFLEQRFFRVCSTVASSPTGWMAPRWPIPNCPENGSASISWTGIT
jgi:hypothetical protein